MADNTKLLVLSTGVSSHEIDPTWDAAQAALCGAMIEVVRLPGGAVLLVDEEGLLKGLKHNPMASDVARIHIVGPAVLVPSNLVTAVLD